MSGILKFVETVCVQTAVYWEPDAPDGFGRPAFLDPVEIPVRWDDVVVVVSDGKGNLITSRAMIMTPGELKEQGYLLLAGINDLSTEDVDPVEVPGAFEIKRIDKTPLFRSTNQFVYTVYL